MKCQFLILLLVVAIAGVARAGSEITPGEFATRRAALLQSLDSSSAVILRTAELKMRSNDVNYRYRQESNFWYLTGIGEQGSWLILAPAGVLQRVPFGTAVLVGEPGMALQEGVVVGTDQFDQILQSLAGRVSTLYVSMPDIRFINDWLNHRMMFLERDVRKEFEQKHEGVKVRNAAPLFHKFRGIKSPAEIALIRKAIAMTGDGITRAEKTCQPGVIEYELQAAIEFEMTKQGASYPAFPSIIGSGPNSLNFHYETNTRKMAAGDMVVMDVGAEDEGYSADVTRTVPVSGRFTKEQAVIYTTVLKAQKAIIAAMKPGLLFSSIDRIAREVVAQAGYGKYWGHGASHHLGLDTHDNGVMDTLRAGMVLTAEPGLYIPVNDTTIAPGYRGIGIRIEDDVLITAGGSEVLSAGIPKEMTEIEKVMKKK
jgi:Xaa-Pro aminopeptidase